MALYDVEVWPLGKNGRPSDRHLTDTTTGSPQRALDRRDELLAIGRADARVLTDDGRVLVEL